MGYVLGFIAALVGAIGFGSNYIPCKQYDLGDGLYFQFVMAIGIWVFGLFVSVVQEPQTAYFHPLALLGGLLWSIGNVLTVPIIKLVGMALGLSIWCGVNLVVGWAFGRFGLLGYAKDESIHVEWLNYLGVVLQLLSLIIFFLVKPNEDSKESDLSKQRSQAGYAVMDESSASHHVQHRTMIRRESQRDSNPLQRQILGVLLATCSGLCYGCQFNIIQYIINTKV